MTRAYHFLTIRSKFGETILALMQGKTIFVQFLDLNGNIYYRDDMSWEVFFNGFLLQFCK